MARIFLSYASDQRVLAERIAVSLRGDGHVVFFDRVVLPASSDFHGLIRKEIRRADLMVFLISPGSVRDGSYCRAELRIAQREWKSPRYRVVSMMVERTPFDQVPPFLREVSILDPEGDAVGELTHAVDWVLRRNRRRWLMGAAAATLLTTLVTTGVIAGYEAWWRGSDDAASSGDPSRPGESSVSSAASLTAPPRPTNAELGPPPPSTLPVSSVSLPRGAPIRLRRLPGGRVSMGSPPHEQVDQIPEPQYEATVAPLWVAETEVTQGQWAALMGYDTSDCQYGCGDAMPVNGVSHHDAILFCNRLSELDGRVPCYQRRSTGWVWGNPGCNGYRLPTEEEWEYAARAGTRLDYGVTDDSYALCRYGNGRDVTRSRSAGTRSGALPCDDGFVAYAPVATFFANPYGLFDLQGNAWEWTWGSSPDRDDARIIRGGSFLDGQGALRVSNRSQHSQSKGRYSVGFRVVRGD